MLTKLVASLGGEIVDRLLGRITGVVEAWLRKEVSMEELRTRVLQAFITSVAEVEKAHADALARTQGEFIRAAAQNVLMARVWAAVTLSQLAVLLWHQLGIPLVIATGLAERYPSSGSTVEWAYALVGACVGLGPLVLRGSAGASPLDAVKPWLGR